MSKAKDAIEEAYDIRLSDSGDYLAQLSKLDATGILSNARLFTKVLFKLCKIVDEQQAQIDALKSDGKTTTGAGQVADTTL